jgi:hypothetical protein|uniref:Uncharacterized protein n=1 Tax=Phaeodactylum tricornutum TaxID=2850 RepID=A0A8J9TCW7_PHATR
MTATPTSQRKVVLPILPRYHGRSQTLECFEPMSSPSPDKRLRNIVDQVSELTLQSASASQTAEETTYKTPTPQEQRHWNSSSLASRLKAQSAPSSSETSLATPVSYKRQLFWTPTNGNLSLQRKRSCTNSFLLQNAPRLPTSPDFSARYDTPKLEDGVPMLPEIFFPSLAPATQIPELEQSRNNPHPPPMPLMSPLPISENCFCFQPLKMRRGETPLLSP